MVNIEEFIKVWQGSKTVAEVVEKTGLTRQGCHSKASRLRRAGIKLKVIRGRFNKRDIERLNRLAEESLVD